MRLDFNSAEKDLKPVACGIRLAEYSHRVSPTTPAEESTKMIFLQVQEK